MLATTAPAPPAPGRPARRRPALVLLLAAALALVVLALTNGMDRGVNGSGQASNALYAPQVDRNAEWVGPRRGISSTQIDELAHNAGIEVIPKFADGYNIEAHFADARKLAAAAKADGNQIKIFDYFSASFWVSQNAIGWGSYAKSFDQSWLLRDAHGQTIPFYGAGQSATPGATPVGYMVDLSNPDYRAWAVKTIVAWMHEAPYAGIVFDSANPMIATTARQSIGNGLKMSYNQLLCGSDLVQQLECPRVTAWNSGLYSLLGETSAALHQLGDEVMYNGIAPSAQRGPSRNLGLLADADMAANESFCLTPTPTQSDRVQFLPFTDDAAIMRSIAAQHKKVMEIVNYQTQEKRQYGDYCLAGFMMGWQPGSSYFVFHSNYGDTFEDGYPVVSEQNLQLGKPTEAGYHTQGDALSRSFQNGFVAVNSGDGSVDIKIPEAGVQFENGAPGDKYAPGDTVTLEPRQAFFMLSSTYLRAHSCFDSSGQFAGC